MGGLNKVNSIKHIQSLGLNIHSTVITNSLNEAMQAMKDFRQFSVRTDIESYKSLTWGNGSDLPFYMQKTCVTENELLKYEKEFDKLIQQGFYLIIANGIKYDDIQSYNAVVTLQANGDFRADISTRKVPLRAMYKYNDIFGAIGNICDDIGHIYWSKQTLHDRNEILRDIGELYTHQIFNKDIELTRYPVRVGMLNDYFVFWQIA